MLPEHFDRGGSDRSGTIENTGKRVLDDSDVSLRPVNVPGGAFAAFTRPHMCGNELALVEDFHRGGRHAHVELLTDQSEGHRVVRAVHFDVIVGMDLGLPPFAELICSLWQRAQCRLFELEEARTAAAVELLEGGGR